MRAEVEPSIRMTNDCELAVSCKESLLHNVRYQLRSDGTYANLLHSLSPVPAPDLSLQREQLKAAIAKMLCRSLQIREVDAGSCNGWEIEIVDLNSPVYDLERLGIHFVASPRHANMLLITGPVTRNMELALRKTYVATPNPKLVVAVGACG